MTGELTVTVAVGFAVSGLELKEKVFTLTTPLPPGLQAAQAAGAALAAEVAKYIADTAIAITNALNTEGDSDAAVQAIADGMTEQAGILAGADPLNPPSTSAPSSATLPGT